MAELETLLGQPIEETQAALDQQYNGAPSQVIGYDDFDFAVSNLTQQAGGKPDKDYDEDEWLFDDGSTETVVGSKITSHKFQIELTAKQIAEGVTQLLWYPHVHWMQEGANEPAWGLRYKMIPAGELEGAWVDISGTSPEFPYVSGALHQISVLPTVDVTDFLNTAVEVKVQIRRDGASDSYVGDARFMGFDFHVPEDQERGSLTEFKKVP